MSSPEDTKTDAPKPDVKGPFLRGGSTKSVTTVATIYDNASVGSRERADGSGQTKPGAFVNAEMARFAGANPDQKPQFNPAYRMETTVDAEGKTQRSTGVFYTEDEIASMRQAAGENVQDIYRHVDGQPTDEKIGQTMVFDADLIIDKERGGVRINHKSAKPTEVDVPANIQDAQFEGRKADVEQLRSQAKETSKKVEAQTEKSAQGAEQAVETEPEFG